MQFEITDQAAISFAEEFYTAVSDGYPVDAALAESRKALFSGGNELEWSTPVLYLRSLDGKIFDVAQTEDPALETSHYKPVPIGTEVVGAAISGPDEASSGVEPGVTVQRDRVSMAPRLHWVSQPLTWLAFLGFLILSFLLYNSTLTPRRSKVGSSQGKEESISPASSEISSSKQPLSDTTPSKSDLPQDKQESVSPASSEVSNPKQPLSNTTVSRTTQDMILGGEHSIKASSSVQLEQVDGKDEINVRVAVNLSNLQKNIGSLVDTIALPTNTCAHPGQNITLHIWGKTLDSQGNRAILALNGNIDIWNCVKIPFGMADAKTRVAEQPFEAKLPFKLVGTPVVTLIWESPTINIGGSLGSVTNSGLSIAGLNISAEIKHVLGRILNSDLCKVPLSKALLNLAPTISGATLFSDSGQLAALCEMRVQGDARTLVKLNRGD